jgi:Activator of Hsp90 ATPase homolog 1-like protein
MPDIRHRVGIAAAAETVYEEVATTQGIANWWSRDVEGESQPGGRLTFWFGRPEPAAVMEVVDLTAPRHVGWRCVEGPDDWVGTTLDFEVENCGGGETALVFTHAGWREPVEFMHHCSTKWATFLIGLRSGLEGGAFTAHPDDTRISSNWQ